MASVHQHPSSPYWQAHFLAFDNRRGLFHCARSTKVPVTQPKARAQLIADRLEKAAKEAAQLFEEKKNPVAEHFESLVAELSALAGSPAEIRIQSEQRWKAWRDYWLSEQGGTAPTKAGRTAALNLLETFMQEDDFLISRLTHRCLQEYFNWLCQQGMTPASVKVRWCNLKACLTRATRLGVLKANPADAVLTRYKLAKDHFEREPFTQEEIVRIFGTVPEEWATACIFGYAYGLRMGDATHRRWSEIQNGILSFISEKKRSWIRLPLIPMVEDYLARQKQKSDWITPSLAIMNRSNLSRTFGRLLVQAHVVADVATSEGRGNRRKNKSFHSWRHTNKTLLLRAGVSGRIADLVNDHESPEIARRYDHVAVQELYQSLLQLPRFDALPQTEDHSRTDAFGFNPSPRTPARLPLTVN